MNSRLAGGIAAIVLLGLGGGAMAQPSHSMGHGMGRAMMGQHDHAMPQRGMSGGMMGRGMQAMLHGPDSTEAETFELAALFHNHTAITREVTNLPDGIRALTESRDPELAGIIVSHVVGMIARVEDGRDAQVPVQSATLDVLYRNRALIDTVLEPTDHGILVIQTSQDPETVAALQTHAAEVSAMVEHGMRAIGGH